jgi:hypothetical protein
LSASGALPRCCRRGGTVDPGCDTITRRRDRQPRRRTRLRINFTSLVDPSAYTGTQNTTSRTQQDPNNPFGLTRLTLYLPR